MSHHKRGLRLLLKDDALLEQIDCAFAAQAGPSLSELEGHLSSKRLAMLGYANLLTRTPALVAKSDLTVLTEAGFSDTDILHIAEVVGYFAYVNRIADGLGVLLEP
ncbi:MAG: hypothetical protein OSB10_10350 [Planctomycetota bacterium]|nr:hypothetical protein [Planctomycetota bacterium]